VCTSLSRLQRDSPPARGLSGLKGQSEREPLEVEGPISCLRYAITHGGHVDKVRCPSGGEQLCAHDIKSPGARVNDRLVTQHLLSCLFAFRSLIDKQSFTSILTFLPTGLPAYTRSSDTSASNDNLALTPHKMPIQLRPPPGTPGKAWPAIVVGLFVSFGGVLFGYDTGTIGGILAMPFWLKTFSTGAVDDLGNPAITSSQSSMIVSILVSRSGSAGPAPAPAPRSLQSTSLVNVLIWITLQLVLPRT
jgi:hypothetical protein